MDFVVSCPACGLKLSVRQENLGREGKCSACGTVFRVDRPGRSEAESPPPTDAPPVPPDPDHPYAPPREPFPSVSSAGPAGLIRLADGLSRGFELLHANIGDFLLVGLVFAALQVGMALPQFLPYVGPLLGLVLGICVAPQLWGGLIFAGFRQHDHGRVEVGDLFAAFSNWGGFALLGLIEVGMYLVAGLPALILLFGVVAAIEPRGGHGGVALAPVVLVLALVVYSLLVFVLINMALCWAYPALLDRRVGVGDALRTGWALMKRNFLATLATAMLTLILRVGGFLLCCVGLIYTAPAAGCLVAATYRTAMRSTGGGGGNSAPASEFEDEIGDDGGLASSAESPEYP